MRQDLSICLFVCLSVTGECIKNRERFLATRSKKVDAWSEEKMVEF